MAVQLTGAELAKVTANRKAQRPTYYNSKTGQDVNISEDFESFLILLPKATKKQGVTWLTQSVTLRQRQLDRDLLLREAISSETDDANAVLLELSLQTLAFTQFRDAVKAGKFAETAELGLMLGDMQAGLDEELMYEERQNHLKKLLAVVEQDLNSLGLDANTIQQTQSWLASLLAY